MTDSLICLCLKAALADRYAVRHELGAGIMATVCLTGAVD